MRPRTTWTDESITRTIVEICAAQGKFPTQSTLIEMGYAGLASAMRRRGGMATWWDKMKSLGFGREECETRLGWDSEDAVAEMLSRKKFTVNRLRGKKMHYDLQVQDVLRVEVKGGQLFQYVRHESGRFVKGWFFTFGKRPSADIIALHRRDKGDVFFIPWYFVPSGTITIGMETEKYARWHNNFDVVGAMVDTRLKELEGFPCSV